MCLTTAVSQVGLTEDRFAYIQSRLLVALTANAVCGTVSVSLCRYVMWFSLIIFIMNNLLL